jgi:hypothetical protein
MAEVPMLNELLKRLGAGKAERRAADRTRRRYPIAWLRDGVLVAAIGLEISEKGILFASREAPPGRHVDVAIDLDERRVRARVKVARQGTMARDGVDWALIAGVFEGIAADDWDAVVRFCKNFNAPANKAAEELAAMAGDDDDAYRLLPLRVQERVVAALIGAGRLAANSRPENALLRMSYAGKTTAGDHRLAVHSRRHEDDEVLGFDSVVIIDDAGDVHLER